MEVYDAVRPVTSRWSGKWAPLVANAGERSNRGVSLSYGRRYMIFLLKVTTVGSISLAVMSAWPGVLRDFAIIPLFLYVLTIYGWIVSLLIALAFQKSAEPGLVADDEIGAGKPPESQRRWSIGCIVILILSFGLIFSGVPTRVAFVLSRPAFQRYAAMAPTSEHNGEPLERWLGVYFVDRYRADNGGGIYFRTHAGADGLGPDTMSYGFAFRPNPKWTPFGSAGYRLTQVAGDWYVFSASNDF